MFWNKWFEPKPFNQGYLPEMDGHKVFFREFGNPKGEPVLVFHGGPGGASSLGSVKPFDLKKYRVILFDQRGCGMSTPEGQWNKNTTADLIADAKRLLELLGIKRKVILRGGSWGAALALKFAETYPERVKRMLLSQIFLANSADKEWMEEKSADFYPDIMAEIKAQVPENETLTGYYAQLISSGERKKQEKALRYYGSYESLLGQLNPKLLPRTVDEKSLAEARIFINYANKRFYLKDDEILKNIGRIVNIPALIVHNRLDFVCPVGNAYRLHQFLPNSKLVIAEGRGHWGPELSKRITREIRNYLKKIKK